MGDQLNEAEYQSSVDGRLHRGIHFGRKRTRISNSEVIRAVRYGFCICGLHCADVDCLVVKCSHSKVGKRPIEMEKS